MALKGIRHETHKRGEIPKLHLYIFFSSDVALSSGSACTSASLEPSYVLRAIGAEEDLAHSSIRFGLGRFTTEAEVDYTAQKCIQQVNRLREMRLANLYYISTSRRF